MNKKKHNHHHHGESEGENDPHGFHRPYWKHAHHDWRLVLAVILMLVAVTTYVMTDDLAWGPRSQPRNPPVGAVGR
ncbi:MAG: hypothetical protein WA740_08850 [Candidatus Binataceae bacterium]